MSLTPGHDRSLTDYHQLLDDVLAEIRLARICAGQAINAERTLLYWRIGRLVPGQHCVGRIPGVRRRRRRKRFAPS